MVVRPNKTSKMVGLICEQMRVIARAESGADLRSNSGAEGYSEG